MIDTEPNEEDLLMKIGYFLIGVILVSVCLGATLFLVKYMI
tara:strand:+ start:701 stop:823 length:123 start_codon:yes stop_codon:yes gene_type:complete